MLGSDNRKVTVIEGHELWFAKSLGHCQHRGINEVKRQIRILAHELTYSPVVIEHEVGDAHRST